MTSGADNRVRDEESAEIQEQNCQSEVTLL